MNEKGTVLIISTIIVAVLMAIGAYLLSSTVVETRISTSMEGAEKAYYLAESGINEAVWKLENDTEWNDNFISSNLNPDGEGNYWSDSITRSVGGGSYEVVVENTAVGQAEITATATVPFMEREAKREVEVAVFRSIDGPTEDAAIFSGGRGGENIHIINSQVTINDGNLFSNHHITLSLGSSLAVYDDPDTEELEGKILATGFFSSSGGSEIINYNAICSRNECYEECEQCPPEDVSLPMVDFDSDEEDSFKSRAEGGSDCSIVCHPEGGSPYQCSDECVLSSREFDDLLWEVGEKGKLVLENDITYVTGHVNLRGGRHLEVNGALVADGNITVGDNYSWISKGRRDEGFSHVETNYQDGPSGLLSKGKISFGNYSFKEEGYIEGVVYAVNTVTMTGVPEKINIKGGFIGRKMDIISVTEGLEVTLDNEKIMYGLGYMIEGESTYPEFSPVIQIDHWEEVY